MALPSSEILHLCLITAQLHGHHPKNTRCNTQTQSAQSLIYALQVELFLSTSTHEHTKNIRTSCLLLLQPFHVHFYVTHPTHLREIYVVVKLHGASLDPQHLQPSVLIRNADVQLTVEPPKPP